ncbi:MAG: elongation factor 4, partial [Candidatus Liptonbacteria bacterium]|nr:elongation factor 4 [Candidatus Liptonbacteria bacterium]
EAPARVAKLEILVAGELVPAMTRIVSEENVAREARVMADRLKTLLPREQFAQAIQARAGGRIIARETIPALRKDVTGYLYGGDRSRKKKLWQKQKRGKEKLKRMAKVRVPVEVFRKILKRTP